MIDFDKNVDELKPNRCRCTGKAILKQDRKTNKFYVICRVCLTRTEKFESAVLAVEVWNNSAGKKGPAAETKTALKLFNADNRKYFCEKCSVVVNKHDRYCRECGAFFFDKPKSERGAA